MHQKTDFTAVWHLRWRRCGLSSGWSGPASVGKGNWGTSSSSLSAAEELSWRDGMCAPRLADSLEELKAIERSWKVSVCQFHTFKNVKIWSAIFKSTNFILPIFRTIWSVIFRSAIFRAPVCRSCLCPRGLGHALLMNSIWLYVSMCQSSVWSMWRCVQANYSLVDGDQVTKKLVWLTWYAILFICVFTARCTLVQSVVLGSHVICLSVTLVNCDDIGWDSSKIISRSVSPGCSPQTPTWRIYSKGNTQKFSPNGVGWGKKWFMAYKSAKYLWNAAR